MRGDEVVKQQNEPWEKIISLVCDTHIMRTVFYVCMFKGELIQWLKNPKVHKLHFPKKLCFNCFHSQWILLWSFVEHKIRTLAQWVLFCCDSLPGQIATKQVLVWKEGSNKSVPMKVHFTHTHTTHSEGGWTKQTKYKQIFSTVR